MKKPSPIENWLKIGSVAFGVSCSCTLPFTQNLAQSALIGLATVPGMATSMVVKSRQRRQQVYRQLERGKLRLQELQHQGAILTQQLEIGSKDRQEIEIRVAQLHSLSANVNARIDRDRHRQQQLERQIAVLAIYCQEQENIATNLESKIQVQQACLLEIDRHLHPIESPSSPLPSAQISLATTNDRDSIILTDIQMEIDRFLATKQELELQIQQLQDRTAVELEELDRSISAKQSIITTLDLAIQSRHQDRHNTELEIQKLDRVSKSIAKAKPDQYSPTFEPQASTIVGGLVLSVAEVASPLEHREIDTISTADLWYAKFIDNPHLTVLTHIEKHGAITEAEASSKLGNARSVRQFANKLEAYAPNLPFAIRVESSPTGNRYIKENQH